MNAVGAESIARHYIAKRNLPETHLCGIRTIPGLYASKKDLLGMRAQIFRSCLPRLFTSEQTSFTLEDLRRNSPISHLALVKGIPYYVYDTGWAGSTSDTPVLGPYLSHMMYKDPAVVMNVSNNGQEQLPRFQDATGENFLAKDLTPENDQMVAWGYIEGLDAESAKRTIDRTIEAEEKGMDGQMVFELNGTEVPNPERSRTSNALQALVNDDRDVCTAYIRNNVKLVPHTCRTAGTTGAIPAYVSTLDHPINASLFLGANPFANEQSGFNGVWQKMLGWRKTTAACTTLCKDLPSTEQAGCRANSLDYFKEINSACVGVSRGFVGHQVRSYPTTFYGVVPSGWHVEGGPGHKSNPTLIRSGGVPDKVSRTFSHLRFGGNSIATRLTCTDDQNVNYQCFERAPVSLMHKSSIPGGVSIEDFNSRFRLQTKFSYKFPAESGTVQICLLYDFLDRIGRPLLRVDNGAGFTSGEHCRDVTSTDLWKDIDFGSVGFTNAKFLEGTSNNYVDSVRGYIRMRVGSDPVGHFDIDNFSFVRTDIGQNLVDPVIGGFETHQMDQLTAGDYAANVIDRLGGIGWWGSSSHFRTGGWAFNDSFKFVSKFTTGASLGESVYASGHAPSGLIFADPIYSPAAALVRVGFGSGAGFNLSNDPRLPGVFGKSVKFSEFGTTEPLFVRAIHGTKSTKGYGLYLCQLASVHDCNIASGWKQIVSESGPAYNKQLLYSLNRINREVKGIDLNPALSHQVYLMLKVENTNSSVQPIHSIFEVKIVPDSTVTPPVNPRRGTGTSSGSTEGPPKRKQT
jgi:hypothetical protein